MDTYPEIYGRNTVVTRVHCRCRYMCTIQYMNSRRRKTPLDVTERVDDVEVIEEKSQVDTSYEKHRKPDVRAGERVMSV